MQDIAGLHFHEIHFDASGRIVKHVGAIPHGTTDLFIAAHAWQKEYLPQVKKRESGGSGVGDFFPTAGCAAGQVGIERYSGGGVEDQEAGGG